MAGLRTGYELKDSQTLFAALLRSLCTTSPWSSWDVCEGFPRVLITAIVKPIIYVYDPVLFNTVNQFGGCNPAFVMSLTIGSLAKDSYSEAEIMGSQVNALLHGVAINSLKFDVVIGLETSTQKTLGDHKVCITAVDKPKWINSDVEKSIYRAEQSFVFLIGG